MKNLSADEYQLKAIEHPDGPVCVLAGPGSGKTYILTHRIRFLIESGRFRPQNILVITFTRKAAEEMRTRFMSMNVKGASSVSFGTFHSVYYQFLKLFSKDRIPVILSNIEKIEILKIILHSDPCYLRFDSVFTEGFESILSMISRKKSGSKDDPVLKDPAFVKLFKEYEQAKEAMGRIDYDDILILCNDMLKKRPETQEELRKRIRYILVDEFQDINPIQAEILRYIITDNNIFIVGDDDQSIYRFRGASFKIMSDFIKDYSMNVIGLKNNYRNPSCILNKAQQLIKENEGRLKDYDLISGNPIKGSFSVKLFDSKGDELNAVKKLVNDSASDDICILVRTNRDVEFYESQFKGSGLSEKQLKKEVYKTVKSYVDFSLYGTRKDILNVIRSPETYIPKTIFADERPDLNDLIRSAPNLITRNSLYILNNHFKVLKKASPFVFTNYLFNVVGLKKHFKNTLPLSDHLLLEEMFDDLLEKAHKAGSLNGFSDSLKTDDMSLISKTSVKVLTFHASKGLEFSTVIIPDVNEGRIPAKAFLSLDNNDEERRLFYVAMTRAKKELYLLAVKKEGSRSMLPSRFITDFLKPDSRL